jgi:hypothetical protein
VAQELYQSARRLRVFVAETPARPLEGLLDALTLPAEEARARVVGGIALLRQAGGRAGGRAGGGK